MTRALPNPDPMRAISEVKVRVTNLERRLDTLARMTPGLGVTWYIEAPLVHEWGKWTPPASMRVNSIVAMLMVAGTTTTTVHLNKNGASVGSVSFTSGETGPRTVTVSELLNPDSDELTAELTAVGTNAEGVTLTARFA